MIEEHLGAITTTEVFLGQLKDGGGDIINISSVAGRTARSGNGVYAATKWGINGWSESPRQELLPDVRVTLVEPGVVATGLPNHIADTRQGVPQLYDKAKVTAEDFAEITSPRAASSKSCSSPTGSFRGASARPRQVSSVAWEPGVIAVTLSLRTLDNLTRHWRRHDHYSHWPPTHADASPAKDETLATPGAGVTLLEPTPKSVWPSDAVRRRFLQLV